MDHYDPGHFIRIFQAFNFALLTSLVIVYNFHSKISKTMKKLISGNGFAITLFFSVIVLFISGCTNNEVVTECLKGQTFGFWHGLWHGIIAPVDLVLMLFRDDITVFAPNNNGAWYAFGFVLGSGGWGFFGGHKASRKCS